MSESEWSSVRKREALQAHTLENPYYTNASQLPVGFTNDPVKALEHQDELQRKYTGGPGLHLYMAEPLSSAHAPVSRHLADNQVTRALDGLHGRTAMFPSRERTILARRHPRAHGPASYQCKTAHACQCHRAARTAAGSRIRPCIAAAWRPAAASAPSRDSWPATACARHAQASRPRS
ncbi:hypothetical protein KM188_01010 [Mycetohabitans sp. B4]|nr:hypothetical protein [Mycetohabitans sp. B4]MCG1038196.1 hypothetical protein [Mycetohabitans sp. B7]